MPKRSTNKNIIATPVSNPRKPTTLLDAECLFDIVFPRHGSPGQRRCRALFLAWENHQGRPPQLLLGMYESTARPAVLDGGLELPCFEMVWYYCVLLLLFVVGRRSGGLLSLCAPECRGEWVLEVAGCGCEGVYAHDSYVCMYSTINTMHFRTSDFEGSRSSQWHTRTDAPTR